MRTFIVSATGVAYLLFMASLVGCTPPPADKQTEDKPGKTGTKEHDHDHEHGEGEKKDDHAHDDHDHDDHDHDHGRKFTLPDSLEGAVKEAESLAAFIFEEIEEKDQKAADSACHDIGKVFEALPALVDKSSLSDDDKAAAKAAGDELFKLFDPLHEKLHAGELPEVGDAKDKINAAVSKLKGLLGGGAAAGNTEGGEAGADAGGGNAPEGDAPTSDDDAGPTPDDE